MDDLTGRKFNKLTVISLAEPHITKSGRKIVAWNCKCDCGNTKVVTGDNLRNNHVKSCGCYKPPIRTDINDIIGQKFGRWTVREYGCVKSSNHHYKCVCDCGTERLVSRNQLLTGKSKSCGCLTREAISKRPVNNKYQPGQRYGRLTIIEFAGENKYQSKLWKCRCDCGNETIVTSTSLGMGNTRSCGCLNQERIYKHGYAGTHLYKVWWGMIDRCTNEKHPAYKRYGGRGITVCDEWKNDLETFINWAKQNGGDNPDLQLDRIDNDKGYSPNNCRFVTPKENQNNKSTTRYVTYKGETIPAKIFAEKYVPWMPYSTFIRRVYEDHWSIEKTISTPTKGKKTAQGVINGRNS